MSWTIYKDFICGALTITQASGNLLTSGTLGAGAITGTSLTDGTATLSGGALTGLTTALTVAQGGTSKVSFTAYTLVCGGTTIQGALQSIANKSTSNYPLISQGTSALPAWAAFALPASVTANSVLYASSTSQLSVSSAFTFDGNTLTILSTAAAPLKVSYDGSNYITTQVGSDGSATFTTLGTVGNITLQSGNGSITLYPAGAASSTLALSYAGKITLGGTNNTNNESLLFDFETTSNVVGVSSVTGVTDIIFASINIQAPLFEITTAPTSNSTGVPTMHAHDANSVDNAGWLPFKTNAGTTVYVPYWS